MVGNLPNWIYLAPTTLNEEKAMLNWAINQRKHPVAIKIPTKPVPMGEEVSADFDKIKYQVKPGKDVAILALGDFYTLGQEVAEKLNATLINPVSANILDKDSLDKLAKEHELIVTLEDNSLDGGFGQKVASYLGTNKVLNFGQRCEYTDQVPLKQIYQDNHLTSEQIIADIKVNLND